MAAHKPGKLVKAALKKAVEKVVELENPPIPGAPSSAPPSLDEPTAPRGPLPPKADQTSPETVSPTGAPTGAPKIANGQQGEFLTTSAGARLYDTDHSLKAGERGPTLLQDHHLREKIMHFDHERIPERVVHARGYGAHGVFVGYGTAANVCKAGFLGDGVQTQVFVRFSTVLGSRGSADTVRDTRGFSTKFYTEEGNFDLVGNNIPVFFIQDGIKFPDIIHAAKPHPDREIPQAQSAHDTFWDFVSTHTEATHHVMWNMSDRGVPRSYRMMEGFGVHTFRLVNAAGETALAKFHWKPKLGVHSLVWEEAQMLSGVDPDFHRRDLADAIESGAYPQWELGLQIMPDTPKQTFENIDLLDPTKIVPEELAPVQPVGILTLNRNTTNFFAETEQVAFHLGNLVPGIDVTDDPLFQARLFSYLDTQLSRLGGPNFNQIPINRPHAPVNDMLRDGFHQHAVHAGVAPYRPNTLDGGNPFEAGADDRPFVEVAQPLPRSTKTRQSPTSFADHYTQPRLFWLSLSPVEKEHVVRAFTFELGKCYEQTIKERQLLVLANVDPTLCAEVARGLGMPAPTATVRPKKVEPSPVLSQIGRTWPTDGRVIGIVVDPAQLDGVRIVRETVLASGMVPLLIAPTGGPLDADSGLVAQRTLHTARSVEFDALLLAGSPPAGADAPGGPIEPADTIDPRVIRMVQECYRHAKAIGAWGSGRLAVEAAGYATQPGIVIDDDPADVLKALTVLLGAHRVWERFPTTIA
ncbi:catalase [Crossiella sp. CA-258035]|uniref:catalase n=1 Tax=Crossiella sp. CA-258035 TaxID=2981138 RepID=UPI0024BC02A2|nr:catalase [Crossiella sp. CA-258035]WHT18421.1 catalase [Crossiella sp. CA-258035]